MSDCCAAGAIERPKRMQEVSHASATTLRGPGNRAHDGSAHLSYRRSRCGQDFPRHQAACPARQRSAAAGQSEHRETPHEVRIVVHPRLDELVSDISSAGIRCSFFRIFDRRYG